MYNSLVIFISSLFILNSVLCEQCSLHDNGPLKHHKEELLKKIIYLNNSRLLVESDDYTYALKVCNDVSKEHPKAAVTRSLSPSLKNTTVVLGRYNNTDIVGTDDWIILTFADGDRIVDNSSCNGSNWKAMILITCDKNVKENDRVLSLLEGHSNTCMVLLQLKISLLCQEDRWSSAGILFTLFLVCFFLYFVIGITYRRFVLGAKGYEQVPHYSLWSSVLALPRELLRKLLSSDGPRHEGINNQPRVNQQHINQDAADEPLLSP